MTMSLRSSVSGTCQREFVGCNKFGRRISFRFSRRVFLRGPRRRGTSRSKGNYYVITADSARENFPQKTGHCRRTNHRNRHGEIAYQAGALPRLAVWRGSMTRTRATAVTKNLTLISLIDHRSAAHNVGPLSGNGWGAWGIAMMV
jgi:hypothetical protein